MKPPGNKNQSQGKVQSGVYHDALFPDESGFATADAGQGTYRLIQDDAIVLSLVGGKRTRLRFSEPLLFPRFLFDIKTEIKQAQKVIARELLPYATTARYRRDKTTITLTPLHEREERFSRNSCLILKWSPATEAGTEKKLQRIDVPPSGGTFQIPPEFFRCVQNAIAGGGGCHAGVFLEQNEGAYLLEEWPGRFSQLNLPQNQNQSQSEPANTASTIRAQKAIVYLSIKDLLDPKDGLERLIEAIRQARSQAGSMPNFTKREEMGKLLDIIRSASPSEEETILANLYRHDPQLFHEMEKRLYRDFLLDFMDPRETSRLLMDAPDEVLAPIAAMEPAARERYRKLISRNRYASLRSGSDLSPAKQIGVHQNGAFAPEKKEGKGPDSEEEGKPLPWQWIVAAFRKTRQRLIFVPGEPAVFYRRKEPPLDPREKPPETVPLDEKIKKRELARLVSFAPDWIGSPGPIQVANAGPGRLRISVEKFLTLLSLSIEQQKGSFALRFYRNLQPSIFEISLGYPARGRIIWGALRHSSYASMDKDVTFEEGFCYYCYKPAKTNIFYSSSEE